MGFERIATALAAMDEVETIAWADRRRQDAVAIGGSAESMTARRRRTSPSAAAVAPPARAATDPAVHKRP